MAGGAVRARARARPPPSSPGATVPPASARSRIRVWFFFQAEDGIRDYKVTGVQTCALPIYKRRGTNDCGSDRAWAAHARAPDRKSTRLNSSHLVISYAVFCLKKKKHNN